MTGKTHKVGGMLCAVSGFILLRNSNMLLPNVNEFIQLAVMYPFAMWGSTAPDLDHHWESCPDKTLPNYMVNKALHITKPLMKLTESNKSSGIYKFAKMMNASHRSWQTHSDLTLLLVILLLKSVLSGTIGGGVFSKLDLLFLTLMVTGVLMGIVAHFILDMLTPSGIWFTLGRLGNKIAKCKMFPEKIRLVPKSRFFATGTSYEDIVCTILRVLTWLAVGYMVITTINPNFFPYEIILK